MLASFRVFERSNDVSFIKRQMILSGKVFAQTKHSFSRRIKIELHRSDNTGKDSDSSSMSVRTIDREDISSEEGEYSSSLSSISTSINLAIALGISFVDKLNIELISLTLSP